MTQNAQSPDFNSIKQVNPYGAEYWSARDLSLLLGYSLWQNFDYVIKRAMKACEQSGNDLDNHFIDSNKMITLGKGGKRKVKDYILSKFACYLVAQNSDPAKPEVAAAQAFFAVSTQENELRKLAEEQNNRLQLRERHIDRTKEINVVAQNAGVQSRNFGVFHDAGYKGLYGGLGLGQIKERKGIADKEDLMDRAGA